MRFPIETSVWNPDGVKHGEPPILKIENCSEALQESLADEHMGVISPRAHNLRRKYFDLPIQEGPLLNLLLQYFDMTPYFHVGCTLDERPPSFVFSAGAGLAETREGRFLVQYVRQMKLGKFFRNRSFRNKRGIRDLHALSDAYNEPGNYTEHLSVLCTCWTGEEIEIDSEMRRMGFSSRVGYESNGARLEYDNKQLITVSFGGVIDGHYESQGIRHGPLYGHHTPLFYLSQGTKAREMAQSYKSRQDPDSHFMHPYHLKGLGYTTGDALFGFMQIAAKAVPPKKDINEDEASVRQTGSGFKPAPKSFYKKETEPGISLY